VQEIQNPRDPLLYKWSCERTKQKRDSTHKRSNDDHNLILITTFSDFMSLEEKTIDKKLHGSIAGSGSSSQEAFLGFLSGMVFGLVSPIIGHPFDCIKTKFQAESIYRNSSLTQTIRFVYKNEGILGFYRGFVPNLLSSMAYRGVLFSAYSGAYAACEHVPALQEPIPYTGGLRLSVILAAMAASLARATIESPFDFIKVRMQVGKPIFADSTVARHGQSLFQSFREAPLTNIRHLYHGYPVTLMRTMGLLGSFFILVDYSVRYIPEVINAPLVGPFFKGGICATTAWVFAFPFETTKSVLQSDMTGKYKNKKYATWIAMKGIYHDHGIRGLYRGFLPGASRSFVANGASMIVYAWFQDTLRDA
jgi:solute carrier family 25 (mitochondrial carnitine/acylcarnitine transporter), member 20/29